MRGSPTYSGKVVTADKNKGIKVMKDALAELERVLNQYKGVFKLKSEVFILIYLKPKVMGDKV